MFNGILEHAPFTYLFQSSLSGTSNSWRTNAKNAFPTSHVPGIVSAARSHSTRVRGRKCQRIGSEIVISIRSTLLVLSSSASNVGVFVPFIPARRTKIAYHPEVLPSSLVFYSRQSEPRNQLDPTTWNCRSTDEVPFHHLKIVKCAIVHDYIHKIAVMRGEYFVTMQLYPKNQFYRHFH